MATAINVALHREIMRLHDAVRHLAEVLEEKIAEHAGTVKLSRTCLQDAVPVTFGQAFGAYLAVVKRGVSRLGHSMLEPMTAACAWAETHWDELLDARESSDNNTTRLDRAG